MCCKCSLSCRSNKLQAAMLACNLLSLWNIVAILMNYSDWKEKNYSEWKTKTAYKRCQWDATHLFLKLCLETSTLAFRSLTSLLLSLLLFGLIGYQLMQPNLGKKFFFFLNMAFRSVRDAFCWVCRGKCVFLNTWQGWGSCLLPRKISHKQDAAPKTSLQLLLLNIAYNDDD